MPGSRTHPTRTRPPTVRQEPERWLSGLFRAACLLAGISTLAAATATATATANSSKPTPCIWLNNKPAFETFASAYTRFADRWLISGRDWFQAYEIGGSARHPLLPMPKEDMGSVKGFVWARDVQCLTNEVDPAETEAGPEVKELWVVRVQAGTVTFSEEGNDWTPALTDAVLWEQFLVYDGQRWTSEDNSVDASVLSTGAKERRPDPAELPARKKPPAWKSPG